MGDACARQLIRKRLLFGVCSCFVSRNASVSVARRGLIVACRDLPVQLFSNFWGLAILKKYSLFSKSRVTSYLAGPCSAVGRASDAKSEVQGKSSADSRKAWRKNVHEVLAEAVIACPGKDWLD